MVTKKIECVNGWIVFIVHKNQVVQVHSSGEVTNGTDDRAENNELIRVLINNAYANELHSQQYGKSGIRWPKEEEEEVMS